LHGETLLVREESDTKPIYDLGERTARFGEDVINFAKTIPQAPTTDRIISQSIGATTSVGAHYVGADDSVSKREFLKCIGTCKKEARETKYFLRMAVRAVPKLKLEARKLWMEARELHLIFAKIWRSGKQQERENDENRSTNVSSFVIFLMEILRSTTGLAQLDGPLFLAIGAFDGVHLGHQAVISTSARHAHSEDGTPVVVTFDPHPAKVLRPENPPHLITSTPHKIALIRALGVGHLLIIPFDKDFAQTEAEDFVAQLTESARGLGEICVGHEWSFGKNRGGNLALLRKLGTRHHFNVVGIPPVKVNGAVVSSTAIRARIERGDFAGAAVMLGRDYTILGTVREGSKLGRQIGFPTANLSAHSEQFPPNGVYFVEAWFEGVLHHGVVNVGFRPTVSGEKAERTIEVHLLDFHRDIYGGDIELKFVQFLRPEKKFEDVEALGKQIAADVKKARELCAA
jgi:riboflavin kinase/FMN adenylyltransferase